MAFYGIKTSRPGKDARTCADHELTFTSESPALTIFKKGTFDFTSVSTDQVVYNHNLGYAPMFLTWVETAGGDRELSFPGVTQFMRCDDTNLEFNASELGYPVSLKGSYIIFDTPLLRNAEYNVQKTDDSATDESEESGVFNVVDGGLINSNDPNDFTINSNYKGMIIHKQAYEHLDSAPYTMTVDHSLGYAPIAFCYSDLNETGAFQQITSATDSQVTYSSTQVSVAVTAYEGDYVVVILNDPSRI